MATRYTDLDNNPYNYTPQELMDLYDENSKQSYFDPKRPYQLQTGNTTVMSPQGDQGYFAQQIPSYTDYDIVGIDTDKDNVEDRKTYSPRGRTPDTFLDAYSNTADYSAINPETNKPYSAATTPTPAATVGPEQSKIDAYTKRVSDAYQGALGYGRNKISQLGFDEKNDPYGLYSGLQSELSRITGTIPDTLEGPSYYSDDTSFDIPGAYKGVPSYVDQYITDTRSKQRKGYERELTNKYGQDYGMTALPDTYDDTYINELLEPQYQDAFKQVEATKKRGLLDEPSYQNALGTLNKQKQSAIGSLSTFGNSYLNTGRNALNSSFGAERNRATDWDYGDNFDIGGADTRLTSEATRQGDLVKSQLASQAGSQSYFDPKAAIGRKTSAYGGGSGMSGSGSGSDALMGQMGAQELRRTRSTTGAF